MRYNPFNPQQPARPDFFVGREPELVEFEKFLAQTMHGSPMNMSITGNRGMGKTSILVKFEALAKSEKCLAVRLSNYEGNVRNIVDLTEYVSTNLRNEILSHKPVSQNIEKAMGWVKTLKPTLQWNEVGLTIEQKHAVQEILRDRLRAIWNEAKGEYRAVVILIDEAESLEKMEGVLSFLREVLQRLAPDANYMVVLAGKLNFPQRMSESFSPLNRFFPSQRLTALKIEEVEHYVMTRLRTVKVDIDQTALQELFERSEGHPYVLVAMCYLIFDALNGDENKITMAVLKRSEARVRAQLVQDFFAPMVHPLSPKAKEFLGKIIKNAKQKDFSFADAVAWTGMENSYLSPYLQELLSKGILNKPGRGKYEIFHKLFLEYEKNELG